MSLRLSSETMPILVHHLRPIPSDVVSKASAARGQTKKSRRFAAKNRLLPTVHSPVWNMIRSCDAYLAAFHRPCGTPRCLIHSQELADEVLRYCGAPTARFVSLTTFLAKTAISGGGGGGDGGSRYDAHADHHHNNNGPLTSEGRDEVDVDEEEEVFSPIFRFVRNRV